MNNFVPNVCIHYGEGYIPASEFFVPPPPQIGNLITAQSTLMINESYQTIRRNKIIKFGLIGGGIAVVIQIAFLFLTIPFNLFTFLFWFLTLSIIGVLLGVWRSRFRHSCSYVGEHGIAEYRLTKNRNNTPTGGVFEFARADAMHIEMTKRFVNGVYQGTSYKYRWVDESGGHVFSLSGTHQSLDNLPSDVMHHFYFGRSAETAWNNYKLAKIIETINSGNYATFHVKGMRFDLGAETMVISQDGNRLTWNIEDIDSINISEGWIHIYNSNYQEMGWFSKLFGKGKISFMYSQMPNAEIFLILFKVLYQKTVY